MKLSSLINELTQALNKAGDMDVNIASPVIGTVRLDRITAVFDEEPRHSKDQKRLVIVAQ